MAIKVLNTSQKERTGTVTVDGISYDVTLEKHGDIMLTSFFRDRRVAHQEIIPGVVAALISEIWSWNVEVD